jgi:hypothetical protein|tara:strand:- start:1355 stop:2719 length:1365 start_codon:yes stop_codon:yes gene_type:complete
MRLHNLLEESQHPETGDIVGFEFGDILIESRVVEHLDDGIVVELNEEGEQYLTELLPLIPVALWAGGAAWTAYDTWKAKKQYDKGEITGKEFAARVGTDVAIGVAGGAVAKGAIKGAKFAWKAGKKIFAKGADDVADAGTDAAKSLVKKAEAPKVDITPKVKADAPIKVKPEVKVVDTPTVKNPQIADLKPKTSTNPFKSKPRLATDKGVTVKPVDPKAVKAPVIGKVVTPKPKVVNTPKVVTPKPKVVDTPKLVTPKPKVVNTPKVVTPKPKVVNTPVKAPVKAPVKVSPPIGKVAKKVDAPTVKPKTKVKAKPKAKSKFKGKGRFSSLSNPSSSGVGSSFQQFVQNHGNFESVEAPSLELISEAEYQGRQVKLNKPMQGDVKKSKVYVKDPKTGNVKKVNFGHGGSSAKASGEKTMSIKKSNPERRKSFRARHNCENPGPKTKARYWSCKAW